MRGVSAFWRVYAPCGKPHLGTRAPGSSGSSGDCTGKPHWQPHWQPHWPLHWPLNWPLHWPLHHCTIAAVCRGHPPPPSFGLPSNLCRIILHRPVWVTHWVTHWLTHWPDCTGDCTGCTRRGIRPGDKVTWFTCLTDWIMWVLMLSCCSVELLSLLNLTCCNVRLIWDLNLTGC